jgi:flagellar protein FlaI
MRIPDLNDKDLSYETGVHIGDGTMGIYKRSGNYQFFIFGNKLDEKQYFSKIIIPLLFKLYGIRPNLQKFENTIFVSIYSKPLVKFKSEMIGLPLGSKSKMKSLPKIFTRECNLLKYLIAGIFDTDGSFKINRDLYPRISLRLKNRNTVDEISKLLQDKFGIKSTVYNEKYFDTRTGNLIFRRTLDINGIENIKLFLQQIPLRNPKNLNRIHNLFKL